MEQIGTLAIYGVGLLGGSVGMAAKARGMVRRVIGIGRSAERLGKAVDLGAIDKATTDLAEGCAEADWVVLASTVSNIVESMPVVATACKPSAIVTDVGSTKGTIVSEAERLFPAGGPTFVGSHPMAGSEQSGVNHASPDLFEDACCIVTMTRNTPADAADRVEAFWKQLGARMVRLDPVQHDRLIASVSHLPHLAAVGIMLVVEELGDDADLLASLLGNGFRDTTRVAEGPAEVWRDICLENREPIADDLLRLADRVRELAGEIRQGQADALFERLERARRLRKRLIP